MNDDDFPGPLPVHLADMGAVGVVLYCGASTEYAYITAEPKRTTCRECLKKRAAQENRS